MGTNVKSKLNLTLPTGATPLTPEEIEGFIGQKIKNASGGSPRGRVTSWEFIEVLQNFCL